MDEEEIEIMDKAYTNTNKDFKLRIRNYLQRIKSWASSTKNFDPNNFPYFRVYFKQIL